MIFDIITIFPELLTSPLQEGILNRARRSGRIAVNIVNLRNYATGPHAMTDDRPFGGGEGMVMKPEPLAAAVDERQSRAAEPAPVILLSPQGRLFNQNLARELVTRPRLILICGRYEGVDERFVAGCVDQEISIGDYILSGGELAAMVVVDAVTRLLPGVLGCSGSVENDSFSRNLLKHPQYTRPRVFRGLEPPGELLSGNHEKIADYRFVASVQRTLQRRPDLVRQVQFNTREVKLLERHGLYRLVKCVQEGQEEHGRAG